MDEDGSVELDISYHLSSCGVWLGWVVFEKPGQLYTWTSIPCDEEAIDGLKNFLTEDIE